VPNTIVESASPQVMKDTEYLAKVLGKLKPELCYQCMKCTSGCPAAKVSDYRPHLVAAMAKFRFTDELLSSGILWACSLCLKCKEYCPQDVSPIELNIALRNLAIERNVKPPETVTRMAKSVAESGFSFETMGVLTRGFEDVSRGDLGLPEICGPKSQDNFRQIIMRFMNLRKEVERT